MSGSHHGNEAGGRVEEAQGEPHPEQPDEREEPQHHLSGRLRRDLRDDGKGRVRNTAEEAPDVVGRVRFQEQAQRHAAEHGIHHHRQSVIRHEVVPVGEERAHATPPAAAPDPERLIAGSPGSGRALAKTPTPVRSGRRPQTPSGDGSGDFTTSRKVCWVCPRLSPGLTQPAKKAGPEGPAASLTGSSDQVIFSSRTVWPRGLRISSMKPCISADGCLVKRLTTQITRKPSGIPSNPQLMLLRSNQPTLFAIGLFASAGHWFIHCGSAISLAMSTSGLPVSGFSSEDMPA